MKLWLDDIRDAPEGWIRCYWPDEVLEFIKEGGITDISLDHDLGDEPAGYMEPERTGMMVLRALERMQYENPDFALPEINIHSMNPVASKRMKEVVQLLKAREHARRVQRRQEAQEKESMNGKEGGNNE